MTKSLLLLAFTAACAASSARPVAPTADPVLAVRRAQMLEWLREYDAARTYPTDAHGMPLSVFRDARGVRCPMAELMFRSGRGDLVDAVVHTNNALRLADVHDGPLYDWMTSSGLTRDEIVMIQGIMVIDRQNQLEMPMVAQASALGEVHGRLATALVALRNETVHALEVAARQRADARATRVASRTSAASPRSSETTR